MSKKFHAAMIGTFILTLATIGFSWPVVTAIVIYLVITIAGRNYYDVQTKNSISHSSVVKNNSIQATAAKEYFLRTLEESDDSDCETNPATGLYMMGMKDTAGNTWGFSDESDKSWNDSSHSDWLMDSSSSIDDQFDL